VGKGVEQTRESLNGENGAPRSYSFGWNEGIAKEDRSGIDVLRKERSA